MRNGGELTRNAEVHMGGALVGTVTKVDPARDAAGQPIALLTLKLNKDVEPLPVDSTFNVRLKGAIGLKYLDLTRGTSTQTYRDGATVPLSQSSAEVDLDQVLSMFDARDANRRPAVDDRLQRRAGRRAAATSTTRSGRSCRCCATCSRSRTTWPRRRPTSAASSAGSRRSRARSPRWPRRRPTCTSTSTPRSARWRRSPCPFLQNWISETPPTFSAVISDSPEEQAFLLDTAGLFTELRPGFATLKQSAPVLADAFATGTQTLPRHQGTRRAPARACPSGSRRYAQTPAVNGGLDRLTLTVQSLRSPLAFLTPVQATCNYVSLFLRNTGSLLAEQFGNGTALRFNVVVIDDVLGGEAVPSSKPYLSRGAGEQRVGQQRRERAAARQSRTRTPRSPGQTRECAAGNEPYTVGHADRQSAREPRHQDREDDEAEAVRRHRPRISSVRRRRDRR